MAILFWTIIATAFWRVLIVAFFLIRITATIVWMLITIRATRLTRIYVAGINNVNVAMAITALVPIRAFRIMKAFT